MATISAGNLVSLRTTTHRSTPYLSVFQPTTLLTALVNNAIIIRGARVIVFDNGTGSGFSTIEAGQLLEVDTAAGLEWVRVKSITGSQTTGTITVDENAILWADNQVLRIKHFYPLVAAPPSIRSGVFYKFFDTVHSTQNATPNPVAMAGSHRAGTLTAGSHVIVIDQANSYAIASGATISSSTCSILPSAGTSIVSGGGVHTITITTAGQRWIKFTVTDSNGKSQVTYRAVITLNSSSEAYKDFTVQSGVTGDWNQGGYRCTIQATGNVTAADFPDGTICILWHENKFDSTAGYVDIWTDTTSQNIIMCGYLRNDSSNDDFSKGTGVVSFEVTTPEALIDSITLLGTVSLNYHASPTTWYQLANMTVGRAIHHLLKWHSWVLETCDVRGLTDSALKVKNIDLSEDSLLQMINGLAYGRGIFAKLVSSRQGRLFLVVDSQMLNTAGRGGLDTTFTITEDDISGVVDVARQAEETLGTAELDGFSYDGATGLPFISICPGYRESSISYGFPKFRGTGTDKRSGQVLIDQTDANEKVGRVLAVANNDPREFRFNLRGNYLGAFDIVCNTGWYVWGVASADLKRQLAYNAKKLVCRNITHTINVQLGTIRTSVVLEPEATGPDGIQGNYPVGYPTPPLRVPSWTPPTPGGGFLYGYFLGGNDSGSYSDVVDRITFSTRVTAAHAPATLTAVRLFGGSVSDRASYGYYTGGYSDEAEPVSNEADSVTFATSVTAAHAPANLSGLRAYSYGISGVLKGYFGGGCTSNTNCVAGTFSSVVDILTFSTRVTAVHSDTLDTPMSDTAALSDGTLFGFWPGGRNGINDSDAELICQRIAFATDVIDSPIGAALPAKRFAHVGLSDGATYGYAGGGADDDVLTVDLDTVVRMTFSTQVWAAHASTLTARKWQMSHGFSGGAYGYWGGGVNTGVSPDTLTYYATADSMLFSTGVIAAHAPAALSVSRSGLGGISDGAV